MIGSLLYLTASHPDICYSISVCAGYQSKSKEYHIIDVKRIISTLDYSIWYSKDNNMSFAGLSDADWAGKASDRKSTSGGYFYLGINLVS